MDLTVPLLQVFMSCVWIYHVDATCRPDQIESCKRTAQNHQLGSFHAGGTCSTKLYVHFTHACVIENYLPSTDFCCCVEERRVMCCIYQQSWGNFRCTQAADTIDKIPRDSPPLEILLPAILLPLAVLICCVVCVIKCCCYKYDSEDNERCDIVCLKCCHKEEPKKACTSHQLPTSPVSKEETRPLSCQTSHLCSVPHGIGSQFSTDSTGSEAKLLPAMDDPIAPATAPPPQDDSAYTCHHQQHHPRYSRLYSDTSSVSGPPHHRDSRSLSTSASIVTNTSSAGAAPDSCPYCVTPLPACPPPTYDEHHRDRILT